MFIRKKDKFNVKKAYLHCQALYKIQQDFYECLKNKKGVGDALEIMQRRTEMLDALIQDKSIFKTLKLFNRR